MTMCKILSHLGGAQYSVEVYLDDSSIQSRIAELNNSIDWLDTAISDYLGLLQEAKDNRDWYISRNNNLISNLNSYPINTPEWNSVKKDIEETTANGLKARNTYIVALSQYNQLIADRTVLITERNSLQNRPALVNPVLSVWCVDLSDGVDGRAIYVANEESELWCLNYNAGSTTGAKYLLPPKNTGGYAGRPILGAHYNIPKAYPDLTAACMTFVNAAMEPGFARWNPIIVSGTVLNKRCINPDETEEESAARANQLKVSLKGGSRYGSKNYTFEGLVKVGYFQGKHVFKESDRIVAVVNGDDDPVVVGFYSKPPVYGDFPVLGWWLDLTPVSTLVGVVKANTTYSEVWVFTPLPGEPDRHELVSESNNDNNSADNVFGREFELTSGSETIRVETYLTLNNTYASSKVVVPNTYESTSDTYRQEVSKIYLNDTLFYELSEYLAETSTANGSQRYYYGTGDGSDNETTWSHVTIRQRETFTDITINEIGYGGFLKYDKFVTNSEVTNTENGGHSSSTSLHYLVLVDSEGVCSEEFFKSVETVQEAYVVGGTVYSNRIQTIDTKDLNTGVWSTEVIETNTESALQPNFNFLMPENANEDRTDTITNADLNVDSVTVPRPFRV